MTRRFSFKKGAYETYGYGNFDSYNGCNWTTGVHFRCAGKNELELRYITQSSTLIGCQYERKKIRKQVSELAMAFSDIYSIQSNVVNYEIKQDTLHIWFDRNEVFLVRPPTEEEIEEMIKNMGVLKKVTWQLRKIGYRTRRFIRRLKVYF